MGRVEYIIEGYSMRSLIDQGMLPYIMGETRANCCVCDSVFLNTDDCLP